VTTPLDSLDVDLTVVLGKTRLPLQRVLRMGRGAVVDFDTTPGATIGGQIKPETLRTSA
jgi:flagellar motor switch/type III secretory pathway protein FliN